MDAGEVDVVAGLQSLDIPLTRGDGFIEVGTYTVVLVTMPAAGEVRHEAVTTLVVRDSD